MNELKIFLVGIFLLLMGMFTKTHASDVVVTNVADSGAGTLRMAVTQDVGSGGMILFDLGGPTNIILTSGEIPVTSSIALYATNLTLNGNDASRIFYIDCGGIATVQLSGVTYTNCWVGHNGGAIYSANENLIVSNCYFVDCVATGYFGSDINGGGAIYEDEGEATIVDCIFSNCMATNADAVDCSGGAVILGGDWGAPRGGYVVRDCEFTHCGTPASGGGLYNYNVGAVSYLEGCTFSNNYANDSTFGGAAFHLRDEDWVVSNCTAVFNQGEDTCVLWDDGARMTDCTITHNSGGNGLVLNGASARTTFVDNCTVSWNTNNGVYTRVECVISNCLISQNAGSGLEDRYDGEQTAVYNSTICSNGEDGVEAADSPYLIQNCAIFDNGWDGIDDDSDIRTNLIIQCTISGNGNEGVDKASGSTAWTKMYNCTVASNGTEGIDRGGSAISIYSCLVVGNDEDLKGDFDTVENCLYSTVASGNFSVTNSSANNLVTTNTGLQALADNGGDTWTHAIAVRSVGQNRGVNPQNLANDQRGAGFSRVVDGVPDIGAFEAQSAYPIPSKDIPSKRNNLMLTDELKLEGQI